MILLDGKKTSNDIKDEIALEVQEIISKGGKKPHLAAILVGNNGASETYVNAKVKACERVGFDSTLIRLSEDVSEDILIQEIIKINIVGFILLSIVSRAFFDLGVTEFNLITFLGL